MNICKNHAPDIQNQVVSVTEIFPDFLRSISQGTSIYFFCNGKRDQGKVVKVKFLCYPAFIFKANIGNFFQLGFSPDGEREKKNS